MNILNNTDAEKYLQNKQVYFRKKIVDNNLKTILEGDKVYDVGIVEIRRSNQTTISLYIKINDEMVNIYECKRDLDLFAWLRTNLIPLNELIDNYNN